MGDMGLKRLVLHDLHVELGGKMVGFAGYEMPVQYPMGVMGEHLHTRAKAGLFDVSHMGQILAYPTGSMEELALALETLMPMDVLGLAAGRQRYGLLTNGAGGILDDLMFANRGDHYLIVVNAACKDADFAHLQAHLTCANLTMCSDRALLALQGPLAEGALVQVIPQVAEMRFMDSAIFGDVWVSRSGYTGEDGFEISVPETIVQELVRRLLALPDVAPIGLGARDSLRLEAGMPLYGHDIDETTSPVEAGLSWAIQKARRAGGARAGGFAGAARILDELSNGVSRLRVGLRPEGRAPMREGVALLQGSTPVGAITSGGFGPSIGAPIAMGYVPPHLAEIGTLLHGDLRGKPTPLRVASMPFHPTNFKR
ncbi:MAG: glycine cleavage system aminomethyltransferase GcvT [Cypionkella sp.]|nr:glycine cleavage system aminomethyltransferase GcvT [Cypionkella sp.]